MRLLIYYVQVRSLAVLIFFVNSINTIMLGGAAGATVAHS
jgi:hypothetical protein